MFKKLSLGLLPIGAFMILIAKIAEFSINDAVYIGGIILILPSALWLLYEIYNRLTQDM